MEKWIFPKDINMKKIVLTTLITLTALFTGCAKDEFGVNKISQTKSTGNIDTNTATQCSSFTLIKPHVDFLFLWDNSPSQFGMDSSLKNALNKTISKVSERFDYRVLLAPITTGVGEYQGTSHTSLIAENPKNLSVLIQNTYLKKKEDAFNLLSTIPVYNNGRYEPTYDRILHLLSWAKSNNIFRKNSYLVIVVMSNGEDTGSGTCELGDAGCLSTYASNKADQIYNYAKTSMQSEQVRLMTMVPRKNSNICEVGGQSQPVHGYPAASARIHSLAGSPLQFACEDNSVPCKPDSYDICNASYEGIFNGINDSIENTLIKHVYSWWPVIERNYSTNPPPFDPTAIRVTKLINGAPTELEEGVDWQYAGFQYNHWTREAPTMGESTTGYFIKLISTKGKVTYPECLVVDTQELADCYQYLQLQSKPNLATLALKINGTIIPQSSTNGWQYVDYRANQDIKMQCPGSSYSHTPEYKTGFFLKLTGNAIYGNNAVIELTYEPASI